MSLFFGVSVSSILSGRYRQKNTAKSVGSRKKIKILRVSIERGKSLLHTIMYCVAIVDKKILEM